MREIPVVEARATGEIIGHAGLQRLDGGDDVELGYYLVRAAWGQGYATETARACLEHGFTACPLERVVAVVRLENAARRGACWRRSASGTSASTFYGAEASLFALPRDAWA
jgi:RimJ/RimL family protein N-acetyltransferase